MAKTTPAFTVTLDAARSFWHARQGLLDPPAGEPAGAVQATGWARTLGGVEVYLATKARCPDMRSADLEAAVENGALRVVPAVRGCIYLVPESDVPVVMALAADIYRVRMSRDLEKAGSTWEEVETVATEIAKVLADGPLGTNGVRKALPKDAARSLGAAGKKVGLSSPVPVALRVLEFRGEIERTLTGGRLDSERYEWRVPAVHLAEKYDVPGDEGGRLEAIVRRFFDFFAPATLKELSTWVGVSQRAAKAAMDALDLVPVAIEGQKDVAWILADDRAVLESAAPSAPSITLLGFEDNLLTVRGGPAILTESAHHGFEVGSWGSAKPTVLGKARHLSYRPLLVGERLAGFWEYDVDNATVVTGTFEPLPAALKKELVRKCKAQAAYIRDEVGHARSFSLDTDDAVRRRAAAVHAMGS